MKRILALAFRVPFPLTEGARIRIYHICNVLAKKYEVDLLAINEGMLPNGYRETLRKVFQRIVVYSFHSLRFKVNTIRGFFARESLQTYYYHFKKVQQWVDTHSSEYDALFCFHMRMTRYLENIVKKPKVIDFIDATSINYREAQERARGMWRFIYPIENRRALTSELKILASFNKAFITSPFDKAYLDENSGHPNDNLIVIPNGIKEELLARNNRFQRKEEDWLVFLGKMDYAPNVDAVTYFAREIFPLVKQKCDVKFYIVGTSPTKEVLELRKMDGVEVTGYVDDPYWYLERAHLVVAPLRFGAGSQYKILEAMALGKAVVTTSKGARGINGKDGEHCLIVDDPHDMAKTIILLCHDATLRQYLGDNAQELVKKNYQWNVIGEKLLAEINDVFSL